MAELRTFTKDVNCTDYSNAFRYRLRVLENSYTVATNSHNITVIFDILGLRSYYNGYADSDATFRIRASSGTTYNADTNIRGSHSTNYSSYVEIGRWTGDVIGNENGTLTITPTVTYGWSSPSYVPHSDTITGTATATTLPRHSDITYTNPCVMGSTNVITVTEKSADFAHKLYYKTSAGSYTQITGGSQSGLVTTYNWAVPNITADLPNASSDIYTLKVETYITLTEHIDSEYPLVANVPASVVPSITIDLIKEGNTAIPSTFPYIINYSRLSVQTTANGVSNSTVQSRYVQLGNEKRTTTVTTNPVTQTFTAPITQASMTIYAGVTDSRLRTKEVNQVLSGAYSYTKPTVELDVTRSDSNGTTNAIGAYVSIKCKWTYDSVNTKNSATIKVYVDGTLKTTYTCSVTTQTTWTQLTVQSASTTTQHTVRVLMEDLLDNAVAEATVSKAVMPISWYDDGTNQGVDFGRMATERGVHHHLEDNYYDSVRFNYFTGATKTAYTNLKTFISGVVGVISQANIGDSTSTTKGFITGQRFFQGLQAYKNIAWFGLSSSVGIQANTSTQPPWVLMKQIGTGFSETSGGGNIVCNKAGTVRATAKIFLYSDTVNGGAGASYWRLNGVNITETGTVESPFQNRTMYNEVLVDVAVNDVLNLDVQNRLPAGGTGLNVQSQSSVIVEYVSYS